MLLRQLYRRLGKGNVGDHECRTDWRNRGNFSMRYTNNEGKEKNLQKYAK